MIAALLSSLLSLSLVRQFIERYAVSIPAGDLTPGFRLVQWGWFGDGRGNLVPFFSVKLPSWSWELDFQRLKYGLAHRVLNWSAKRGWRIFFEFHYEDNQ